MGGRYTQLLISKRRRGERLWTHKLFTQTSYLCEFSLRDIKTLSPLLLLKAISCVSLSPFYKYCFRYFVATGHVFKRRHFKTEYFVSSPLCLCYRLQALVEREWLQAGHPFPRRHSHSVYSPSRTKQNAPTFLLFLDCIFQIQTQFPCSFEFSSSLLVQLFEHSYSSKFG